MDHAAASHIEAQRNGDFGHWSQITGNRASDCTNIFVELYGRSFSGSVSAWSGQNEGRRAGCASMEGLRRRQPTPRKWSRPPSALTGFSGLRSQLLTEDHRGALFADHHRGRLRTAAETADRVVVGLG